MTANPSRHWRETMGFSREQAAEALGYSVAMLKKWENEPEEHPVPLAVLLAMAAIYHNLEPWPV